MPEDEPLPQEEEEHQGSPNVAAVISRSKSRQGPRRTSLAASLASPVAKLKPVPFRRAQTENFTSAASAGSGSFSDWPLLKRSDTSVSGMSGSFRHKSALMRRMSSFGGAPIYIPPTLATAVEAEAEDAGKLRWAILLLTCLLLFGNYYAYDNPAALNRPLQQYLGHDYDTWQYELNLLYSVYSFPNMFLPFLGGQLVDRVDVKKVLVVFSAVVCMGQTLFAVGVSSKSFGIMLLGRVLFGIGGESIGVVQASITTAWFRGKELAFALGLTRFGSVVNANLSPRIEKHWTSAGAVWVGGLTCYISFGCALILVALMSNHSPSSAKSKRATSPKLDEERPLLTRNASSSSNDLGLTKEIEIASSSSNEDLTSHKGIIAGCLSEITLFPGAFWLVCLVCVLLYGTVVPFNNIASDFLMSKWYPGDTQTAGTVMSIPDTMSALLVPICGVLVDRYGGRASLLVFCALVIAAVHATLGLTMITPVIPLVFLGLSYSMYGVAIWPSIATIIQHREAQLDPDVKLLGTAYGLSTSALNTALTIMPLIAAKVRVWSGDFLYVELFFVCLALLGAVASAVLWVVDVKFGDGVLQMPEAEVDEEPDASRGYFGDEQCQEPGGYGATQEDESSTETPKDKKKPKPKLGKAIGIKVKNRGRLDKFLEECDGSVSPDRIEDSMISSGG
ncbi:hypothetical protein SpCBS45565_g01340 [Spizellomyces sp. 'palustris']|nr:hypothetical protein SpCBS45565_g01340 [Spizellomyces sp. 'palustris']